MSEDDYLTIYLKGCEDGKDKMKQEIEKLQQAKDKLQKDYQEARDRIDEFKFTIKTQQQMIDELINKIDKAIEHIKKYQYWNGNNYNCLHCEELLELLGDGNNE